MKLVTPFIIIAICAGMYFLYISPTVSEVKALSLKKSNYDQVLLKSKELKSKRDDILLDYNSISSTDIDNLNKIIPETFNSVLFANDINSMVSKNKLIVKDFNVNPQKTEDRELLIDPQDIKPYVTAMISFTLTGQYQQFVSFLKDLESSMNLVDIVKISVKTVGSQKSVNDPLEYTLEMNTYSLR